MVVWVSFRRVQRFLLVFLCVTLSVWPGPVVAGATSAPQFVAVVSGSLVGSAYALSDRILVTSGHVVKSRKNGQSVDLIGPYGQRMSARIVAISKTVDMALLATRAGHDIEPLATSSSLRRGLPVLANGVVARHGPHARSVAFGNLRSDMPVHTSYGWAVFADMPQARPGYSGGPVLTQSGHVIGMLAALRPSRSGAPQQALILTQAGLLAEARRLLAALGERVGEGIPGY